MAADRPIACITFVGNPSADTRILRTADALADDFDVHIITLSYTQPETVPDVTIHAVMFTEGAPLRKTLFPFWRKAAEICADLAPALCLASDLYSLPAAARAAKASGVPLVYDSRELYGSIAALQGRKLRQRFWNIIERRYASGAAAILTVNDDIANILRKQYTGIPVHVAYNVPMATFTDDPDRSILRKEFGIPEGQTVLISNGGLQKGRGLTAMIDVLEELPNCHLVFLGDGPLRSELELYALGADCSERVHFNHVPSGEVLRWTSGADIGLCFVENLGLSYYLSLPNKFFEYMHAGIPAVCTDLPVIRTLIERHASGVLIPEGERDAAVNAIRKLIEDRDYYQGMCGNAETAAEHYSWGQERTRLREVLLARSEG